MPIQPDPPYAPEAMSQPRLLQRWLDINSQNGPLERIETYVTLPVFTQAVSWKGYSEIGIAFNFEGPNSFSLKSLSSLPIGANYTLAIMWKDQNNITHRYAIWRASGDVIYFEMSLYTGQVIKNNFRLEVWTTNVVSVTNTAAVNLYTSVRGNIDYRYGVDTSLVNADPAVTNFQCANVIPVSPNVVATDYFNPAGILAFGDTFISWTPIQGIGNLSVALNTPTVTLVAPLSLINTTSVVDFNLTSTTTNLKNLFIILSTTTLGGALQITKADNTQLYDIQFGLVGGIPNVSSPSGNIPFPLGQIFGIAVTIAGGILTFTVYNQIGVIVGTHSGASGALSVSYVKAGLLDNLYELIQTNAAFDFASYIHANYGTGLPLPLTFPTNSTPTANTI